MSAEGEMADLWDSCFFGKISLARAREQLERGADVNYVQSNSTCLMSAVRSKNRISIPAT